MNQAVMRHAADGGPLALGDGPGVFVQSTFGEVHVVVDGDPAWPAVATVHGIPGSARDFRALGRALVAHRVCTVRIDMPGFGRTPQTASLLRRPEERAALVIDVMRARGHRCFAVVGHSFGGSAALACAALWPEHVVALAMVCSVGVTRHAGLQIPHGLTGALGRLTHAPVVGDRLVAVLQRAYERVGIRRDGPLDAATVYAETQIIGALDFADLRNLAARVRCPALVVGADDDRLVERDVSFALAAALSSACGVTHRRRRRGGHQMQKHDAPAIAAWLAARICSRPPV